MNQTFHSVEKLILLAVLFGGLIGACSSPRGDHSEDSRPNILLILADDMGFSDIGSYGGEVDTPTLDRLAEVGVRFSQFYNTARCSPTRASLLTGLYPHQAGLGHMPDFYAENIRARADSPAYQDHLAFETPTVAEILRDAGYSTYMTGKWHLGYERPQWPVDRGFDRSFSTIEGAYNYYGYGIQMAGEVRNPLMALDGDLFYPPVEGFFTTDAYTDYATQYLNEHDVSKPFFMYVAYNAPHWPLQAPVEDVKKYRGSYMEGWDRIRAERFERLKKLGLVDPSWELAPRPDRLPAWNDLSTEEQEEWDLEMAIYAAQIERMDAGIGRILTTLEDLGMEENTLVVFLSDNGGAAEDPNGSLEGAVLGDRNSFEGYDLRGAHVSSAPFRRTKRFTHEGGIATPFIARWPEGFSAPGEIRNDPAHLIDLAPTFLEIAGVSIPEPDYASSPALPGTSLIPAFKGLGLAERPIFWEHEGNRGVRRGKWKLVSVFPEEWELYDMEKDRSEMHNLAADVPDVRNELTALYETWAETAGVKPWDEIRDRN